MAKPAVVAAVASQALAEPVAALILPALVLLAFVLPALAPPDRAKPVLAKLVLVAQPATGRRGWAWGISVVAVPGLRAAVVAR